MFFGDPSPLTIGRKRPQPKSFHWPFWSAARIAGSWWVRIKGYGISYTDHQQHPPLFSERNGYVAKRLHVGRHCLRLLSPEKMICPRPVSANDVGMPIDNTPAWYENIGDASGVFTCGAESEENVK